MILTVLDDVTDAVATFHQPTLMQLPPFTSPLAPTWLRVWFRLSPTWLRGWIRRSPCWMTLLMMTSLKELS